MKLYNEKTKELNDAAVICAIKDAESLYSNGCLSEARDMLVEIVYAIDLFDERYTN